MVNKNEGMINKNIYLFIGIAIVLIIVVFVILSLSIKDKPEEPIVPVVERKPLDAFDVDLNTVDFSASTSQISTAGITPAEKRAVYEALLVNFKAFVDKDVKSIRQISIAKATTEAEKNLVRNLSDSDILSLAERISNSLIMPPPDVMLSPSSIWLKEGNSMTITYDDPVTGPVTKKAVLIDGKWY
jgi:hypothetical protein